MNELLLTSRRAAAQQEAKQNAAAQDEQRAAENRALAQTGLRPGQDPFQSRQKFNQAYVKRHLIGRVVIPKLAVDLPLFDTTNNTLLDQGAVGYQAPAIRGEVKARIRSFRHTAAYPPNAFSLI